mmetsp:Transcript_27973/g.63291  ORF Transcript_27973/g.63291 Transcript_27973/m.63291 type:complete len:264 (-) Transcript_27973:550-1341(-)
MAALSDPFHAVKAEVTSSVGAAETLVTRWQQLEGDKKAKDERARLRQQLGDLLLNVNADLDDLNETITVVERQRSRFRIDDAELRSRKTFVSSMRGLVESLFRQVDLSPEQAESGAKSSGALDSSPPSSVKGDAEREKEGLLGGGGSKAAGGGGRKDEARDRMLDDVQQQQQLQIAQQDDLLDGLGDVVGRLKVQGEAMHEELEAQGSMLEQLSNQVDVAGQSMKKLKSKMNEMATSKDRGKYCAIMVLTCLLFVLTYLVMET